MAAKATSGSVIFQFAAGTRGAPCLTAVIASMSRGAEACRVSVTRRYSACSYQPPGRPLQSTTTSCLQVKGSGNYRHHNLSSICISWSYWCVKFATTRKRRRGATVRVASPLLAFHLRYYLWHPPQRPVPGLWLSHFLISSILLQTASISSRMRATSA